MKKLLVIILALAMVLSIVPCAFAASAGLSNFKAVNEYVEGQFEDIKSSDWFKDSVKSAFEFGLVKGSSANKFNPNGNITIAETLALAARLNSIYNTGKAEFEQGQPWYQVYVDYAIEKGIITSGQFKSYEAQAKRSDFAIILASALPNEALEAMNTVEDNAIPDVKMSMAGADKIYSLYRAGVLTGNDASGTFTPNTAIQRSAVAAIVARMADKTLRKVITLLYKFDYTTDLVGEWRNSSNPIESFTVTSDYKLNYNGKLYTINKTPISLTEVTCLLPTSNKNINVYIYTGHPYYEVMTSIFDNSRSNSPNEYYYRAVDTPYKGKTIELTMDNWSDFFEIKDDVQKNYNTFGEVSSYSVGKYVLLKPEYKYAVNFDLSKPAIEMSYKNGSGKLTLNKDLSVSFRANGNISNEKKVFEDQMYALTSWPVSIGVFASTSFDSYGKTVDTLWTSNEKVVRAGGSLVFF